MDFRKELAKELGLGAISENTMLDDYVKACEAIAVRYHEIEVKKSHIQNVVCSALSDEVATLMLAHFSYEKSGWCTTELGCIFNLENCDANGNGCELAL